MDLLKAHWKKLNLYIILPIKPTTSIQRIKALLFKSKYILILEEEAQITIVDFFKSEIESADVITKHLLENMLATMYWQYYQQHRYRFYERTTTSEKVSDDFRTWDLVTLINEIDTYYKRSLENEVLLQQELLEDYKVLILDAKNSKDIRPTLYDLLSHNALQFYKTDETSITQPIDKFSIDHKAYAGDSEEFINLEINSNDSLSLQKTALKDLSKSLKVPQKITLNIGLCGG